MKAAGVVQQRSQALRLHRVEGAGDGLVVDFFALGQVRAVKPPN